MTNSERDKVIEELCVYIESESWCLMPIIVHETRHDYGVRLLKILAAELREQFKAG